VILLLVGLLREDMWRYIQLRKNQALLLHSSSDKMCSITTNNTEQLCEIHKYSTSIDEHECYYLLFLINVSLKLQ
jgi:hypothetical protein